jgi:hypothetical protein
MAAEQKPRTHRDLLPRDTCTSLMFKHILTHGLDEPVRDDRDTPGDGYSWCQRTCTPVGPDDELANPKSCRPSRVCWRGITATS